MYCDVRGGASSGVWGANRTGHQDSGRGYNARDEEAGQKQQGEGAGARSGRHTGNTFKHRSYRELIPTRRGGRGKIVELHPAPSNLTLV